MATQPVFRCSEGTLPERWLRKIVLATCVLFALLIAWYCGVLAAHPGTDQLEVHKLFMGGLKFVLVGFCATLIGILVPAILSDSRHRFRRLRESRTHYSAAKTGVDYLPLRICTLRLHDAGVLIQRVHVRKHMAELFEELATHLEGKEISKPALWMEDMYHRLWEMRNVLEQNVATWDTMRPTDRLRLMREVEPVRPPDWVRSGTLKAAGEPPVARPDPGRQG